MIFVVRYYLTATGADPFAACFETVRDRQAQARVQAWIRSLFGEAEPCGESVWELRIDWRPGYRVYYA
jgi:putative addiction module killer protein